MPPSDLETSADVTFVFEQAPDRNRQATATDQLILLDVEIYSHGQTTPGKHIRRVLWSRRITNRQAMLALTASVTLCEVPGTTCELSINHHIWPEEDTANRHVLHGDFVRLRIHADSPSDELHMALCEQEFADAQRYVFGRSPSRSPTPSNSVQSGEEEGQSEEAASLSLLQLKAASTNSEHQADSISSSVVDGRSRVNASLKGANEPHVDDLWCAPSSLSDPLGLPGEPSSSPQPKNKEPCHPRAQITLEQCIPPPIWLRIPITDLLYLSEQLSTVQMGAAHGIDQVVKWHDTTKSQFESTPAWSHELPLKYYFFTDGSSIRDPDQQGQRVGASAIVLIVQTDQGLRWGGSRTFQVGDGPTAPKTEIVAIVLALLWCVQVGDAHPHQLTPFQVSFGYDCQAAGHVAAGQWRIKAHHELQTHGRALALWVQHRFNVQVEWEHIHSHTGHPWNEAADALSWAAVHNWIMAPPAGDILQQLDIPDPSLSSWLWMVEASYQQAPGLPTISDRHFLVNAASPLAQRAPSANQPFMKRQLQESPQQARKVVSVEVRFATANVLTLYDSNQNAQGYISARQEALMEQMFLEELHFIGTQETRSKCDGYLSTERYHVLAASATKRGSGGVQLWVSKTFAFPHRQMHISVGDLKILHATSKRLVVRINSAWIRLIVCVCHAPASSTLEEAEIYWQATSQSIPKKYQTWPTVYLCDANARLGEVQSGSVGGHGAEDESPAGTAFHHWLQQHDLLAPQTFAAFHRGLNTTWTHAKGAEARLDYVVIDKELAQQGLCTFVSDRIDLTTVKDDHQCVCATVPWGIWDQADAKRGSPMQQADHQAEDVPLQSAAPQLTWQCNVHEHAAQLQRWLYSRQPPKQAPRKRKPHMTDATWRLVCHKKYHWKRIRQLRFAYRIGMQGAIFKAWKKCRSCYSESVHVAPWLALIDHQTAQHTKALKDLTQEVRVRVRADDKAYYEQIAAHTAAVAADEGVPGLWQAIKAILPKQRSKMKHSLRACGPDPHEITQHFQALEAGTEASYDHLLTRCQEMQQDAGYEIPLEVSLRDIPSRIDMEQVIMKQKARKAPGLDGVTSETLRQATCDDSLPFFQLILKAWTLGAEPIQFKGGLIHCIAKKSGSLEAHKMRGIMLLDSLAKAFHALVRQSLLKWMIPRRLPCQMGGFSAQQTLYATQLLRSITRLHQRQGLSSGVLFVDVRAAFHSLLREMAFGGTSEFPEALKIQLSKEGFDVDQLQAGIDAESSEFTTTAPPILRRLAQETHSYTWFTLSQHDCSYQTHRGSRPGSPLADLAYNVMMRNALLQLTRELEDEPALQYAHQVIGFRCPPLAWVDDVAIPFATAHAQKLDETALKVLHIVHRVFTGFGLRLNLEKGKTEAVLQYRGQAAAEHNKVTFVERLGRIPIPPAHGLASAEALRAVSDYMATLEQFFLRQPP